MKMVGRKENIAIRQEGERDLKSRGRWLWVMKKRTAYFGKLSKEAL